jgi:hypothetical protein
VRLQGLCGRAMGSLCLQLQQAGDVGTMAGHDGGGSEGEQRVVGVGWRRRVGEPKRGRGCFERVVRGCDGEGQVVVQVEHCGMTMLEVDFGHAMPRAGQGD